MPLVAVLLALPTGRVRGQETATVAIQIVQGGTGVGTVTSDSAGIDCTRPAGIACIFDADVGTIAGQCGTTFPTGSTVSLTAIPAW